MKIIIFKKHILFLLAFCISTMVHAGIPVWTFTPNPSYPPTVTAPANGTVMVKYTVTNQSVKPHTLVMTAIPGITPAVTGCAAGCPISTDTLCLPTQGSTCMLTLTVNGSQLQGNVTAGPELCQQGGGRLQCYTPANPLNITLVSAQQAPIAITAGSPLTLDTNGSTGTMTITNNSTTVTATNINANFSGTALQGYVTQTGSTCSSVLPGQSCTLTFTPGSTPVSQTSFPIKGDNTTTTTGQITIASSTTTLSVTPSTLTLSVTGLTTTTGANSGTPRVFTIHNIGSEPAMGVACPTSSSASITSIACTGCGTILSGGMCTVTITPSATPSAAVADTSPTPVTLSIQGTNTNTLSPTVNVLTYGSFYQAGWLFSIIETANTSASIGGTVAAETDAAGQSPGVEYSSSGASTNSSMHSGTDGAANTSAMVTAYGTAQNYSAGYCISSNYSAGGYTDWYLPAECEMGYGGSDSNFSCGASPGSIPNMQYNLLDTNTAQNFNFVSTGFYWSSAASEYGAPGSAWSQEFVSGGGGGRQFDFPVDLTFGVRCARAITN